MSVPASPTPGGFARQIEDLKRRLDTSEALGRRGRERLAELEREEAGLLEDRARLDAALATLDGAAADALDRGVSPEKVARLSRPAREAVASIDERIARIRDKRRTFVASAEEALAKHERGLARSRTDVRELEASFARLLERVEARSSARPRASRASGRRRRSSTGTAASGADPPSGSEPHLTSPARAGRRGV